MSRPTKKKQKITKRSETFSAIATRFAKIAASTPNDSGEAALGERWCATPGRSQPGYQVRWDIRENGSLGVAFNVHSRRLALFLCEVLNAYERETGRDAFKDFNNS